MKRLIRTFFCVFLYAVILFAGLSWLGITSLSDVQARLPQDFAFWRNAVGDAAQKAIDQGASLVSQFADHIQPSGEGHLQQGELPEDQLEEEQISHNFPGQMYPYREMLSEGGRQAYDQIYANAAVLYDQIPLRTPIPRDTISTVMSALFYDHPELFWLETSYQYTYNSQNQIVSVQLAFNETADNIEEHRLKYDQVVQQVVAEARQLPTPVEQEKYVHDYLLDHVSYQLNAPLNQSSYSALVYGQSVCAGYARAFQHLLLELGIPCYYCTGYASDGHAWNIVMLDGEYYNVDVAWNDPLGNESGQRYYNYFNVTDEVLFADHTRTEMSLNLPACTGTKYSYENAFGTTEEVAGQSHYYSTVKTPEEAGFSRDSALASLDQYYGYCTEQLLALGTGTHTFSMLIANQALLDEILAQMDSNEGLSQFVQPVVTSLGLNGYSAKVSVQGESLADGYWLLTQQVQLEEGSLIDGLE